MDKEIKESLLGGMVLFIAILAIIAAHGAVLVGAVWLVKWAWG